MNDKRLFIKFLKEKEVYSQWVYNLKRHFQSIIYNNPELWESKKRNLYANTCYSGISSAFNWSNTKEGHVFWRLINEKWIIFRKALLLKQN